MLNTVGASMQSARQLVTATENAGGTVPPVLTQIIAGFDLLTDQRAPSDPARGIIDAAAEGSLTAERLTELCAEATRAQAAAEYQGQLRQRAEGQFTERFYKSLCDRAADDLLDSLRDRFDQAATTLADATAHVDININPQTLADTGTPEQLDAWRSIKPAVAMLDEIAGIASRFGPRSVDWAILDLPNALDHRDLRDDAIMCVTDDLVRAGTVFRARTADIRTVPWLRITPRLNSITEAKERLRVWAEHAWTELNTQTGRGHFEDGQFVAEVRRNPYAKAAADA